MILGSGLSIFGLESVFFHHSLTQALPSCVFLIYISLKKKDCQGSAHRNYLLPFFNMGVEKLLQKTHMTNSTICTNV